MRLFFLLLLSLLLHAPLTAQHYWQQRVNYTIDVTLDDTAKTLDGFAKIEYINNSPDTLHFIWFHLWPNAFKNDKTAFSDQLLGNGRTDFYFSSNAQRGYINRLDFRVAGVSASMEDHPQHIDIVKVVLPQPLAPGGRILLSTPFHVQLPQNFSRGGYVGQSFQVTQWYPKPAVYDRKGWHAMPYLDQGEFYSEFGDFDVRITLPGSYVVAATGDLQSEEKNAAGKTLRYTQPNVHDFAWFANKDFIVKQDTVRLPSGKVVKAYSYYTQSEAGTWANSVQFIKDALRFRSTELGEYPYNVASVVQGPAGMAGGMEYPTITLLRGMSTEKELDFIIEHELGHNWFYGILASNERLHPWMDEGMNTFYDVRYLKEKYGSGNMGMLEALTGGKGRSRKLPDDDMAFATDIVAALKKDQPINTHSADFTAYNYGVVAYMSAARWMQRIEAYVGKEQFDAAMKQYYEQWKFRHPYPEDFRKVLESATGKDLGNFFAAIDGKETMPVFNKHRKPALTAFFSAKDYKNKHYIALTPAIGNNKYDKFMIGVGIHNYSLPMNRFRFAVAPLYATGTSQLNAIGKLSYTWLPDKKVYSVQAGVSGSRFSTLSGTDSNGAKVAGGFYKIVPFVRVVFNNGNARSKRTWWLDLRHYQIGEKGFSYVLKTADSNYYPVEREYETRYLNQLTIGTDNFRVLYPYDAQLQLQQAKNFYRLNFTGNYFFNYATGGGMNVRLFAAKFGYLGNLSSADELDTYPFQPKLTAVRGNEDYTYGNYFIGRNEQTGLGSQQIMMRDGGLKLRTDLFQGLQGRSDDWVASMNFTTTLPDKLFPIKLPLRLFADVGTYAGAWEKQAATARFLYVGGIQLSLFGNLVNVYAPIVFSKEFRDNLKTVPEEYKFFKRLSFSIDVHTFYARKVFRDIPIF